MTSAHAQNTSLSEIYDNGGGHSVHQSSCEFSFDDEMEHSMNSSKYRRMSAQVTIDAAAIKKVEDPIPLEELEKKGVDEFGHLQTDSAGHIVKIDDPEDVPAPPEGVDTEMTNLDDAEQESLLKRILNSKYVRRTIYSIRSHPALILLFYIIFVGFVEGLIFADIITGIFIIFFCGKCRIQKFLCFKNVNILKISRSLL